VAGELKFQRRDILRLTVSGAAGMAAFSCLDAAFADDKPGGAPPAASQPDPMSLDAPKPPAPIAEPGVLLGPASVFEPGMVLEMARSLSKQPFKAVSSDLPDPFKSVSNDQYAAIKLKPEARIWASESIGFVVEPLHRGFQFNTPIQLNLVAQGKAYKLVYDVKMFDFGGLSPSPKIGDIGFSGFRILVPQAKGVLGEIATFQGANFFRALAEGQVPGLMARALAIKVADAKGEEMPVFRSIWIEKPSFVASTMILHALIDSDSVVGAFRFTIRPGEATIIDTECTLFPRTAIDNFGLASMSATHLLGFMDHKKFDDYRPNVSETCGLQMLTGNGEWIWRPVTNRENLQISTFVDNKPRGFGCLVRNRDFEDYDDEDNHWEKRPSLWIEPLGEWMEGGVQLIEIPSQSDANDNILCFWRPKEPLKAGSEVSFAYRQFWCWDPPERPDLARAMRSRSGSNGKHRRFFVEFEGDIFADLQRTSDLTPTVTASGGSIVLLKAFPTPEEKSYRVLFELDPGSADSSELRLVLQSQGKPISETWLYRWTPA
jgi:glucans biosynthesis protein